MSRCSTTAALAVLVALAACSSAADPSVSPAPATASAAGATQPLHTAADVAFMVNMIGHHAQAVRISRWAPTHGASPAVLRLAERIVVGQQDEIDLMARWLRSHGETVPPADSSHQMSGMDHSMHMPGMLTGDQLAMLDSARGPGFDRLFLTFMIQHHEGAVTMVDQLFASQGAGEEDTVFRLASDVQADQVTEIRRMQQMLEQLPPTTD
jgi:uncharacterized protein (DUF305 family)